MQRIKRLLIYKILREIRNLIIQFPRRSIAMMPIVIKNHFYDKRLGIEIGWLYPLKEDTSLYKDAIIYTPTPYYILEKVMDYLRLGPEDVFIDLGSGEGRVVSFVATQRLKKVIGIELHKDLADATRRNSQNLKLKKSPIEIINADVANFNFKEGTVFFMFNPFGSKTLERVIANIKDSLNYRPRKIRIVYYCAVYRELLDSQDWLIPEGEINKTEVFVWRSVS